MKKSNNKTSLKVRFWKTVLAGLIAIVLTCVAFITING